MDMQTIVKDFKESINADAKAIKERLDGLDSAVVELSQRQEGAWFAGGQKRSAKSLGQQAADLFADNADVFQKSGSLRLELKAAGDAVTTASGRGIIAEGVGVPSGGVLGLQNAIQSRDVLGVSAIEYSRFTGLQGAAAVQAAEGDAKAAVRPNHTIITQSAITIAGYTVMSRQAMADRQELTRAVEVTLARSIAATLDDVLWSGTVSPAWDGLDALATVHSSSFEVLADAVSDAVGVMQLGGFVPDVVAVSPTTWTQILTLRADSGAGLYLSGNYLGMTEPTLRGLRVVPSASVREGVALVMDSSHIEVVRVQAPILETGTINDQFTRNLVSLLMEIRVAPVFRTVGAAVLAVPSGVSL